MYSSGYSNVQFLDESGIWVSCIQMVSVNGNSSTFCLIFTQIYDVNEDFATWTF